MKETILIVDDEAIAANAVQESLSPKGYACTTAFSAEEALNRVATAPPDLIVLDVSLPDMSGLEFCQILRKNPKWSAIPILMLTSMNKVDQKVRGLDTGADDYMTKPFADKELCARVAALLRRRGNDYAPVAVLRSPGLEMNLDARELAVDGQTVALTSLEFDLLKAFLQRKGVVHTFIALAESVWGDARTATSQAVTLKVSRLKQKLGPYGDRIKSVVGLGYKFVE